MLHICLKGSKGNPSLATLFNHDIMYYIHVVRVTHKGKYTNNVTRFILEGVTEGSFIVVLEDKCGGNTHTIGINIGLNVIFDCIETHKLKLNHRNLSKCCAPKSDFVKFWYTAELKDNRVHAKTP